MQYAHIGPDRICMHMQQSTTRYRVLVDPSYQPLLYLLCMAAMAPNSITNNKPKPKKPKKPYRVRKSDLHLDEYKQQLRDKSPTLLLRRIWSTILHSRRFHLYLAFQALAAVLGYGQFMLCVGM